VKEEGKGGKRKKKSRKDGRIDQTTDCWYLGLECCSPRIFLGYPPLSITGAKINGARNCELIKKAATLVKVMNILYMYSGR
jgi:hypothetical protein